MFISHTHPKDNLNQIENEKLRLSPCSEDESMGWKQGKANRYSWCQESNPESGGQTVDQWADSNLQYPRGVGSRIRKQKKGIPFLPHPKPKQRVLMTG